MASRPEPSPIAVALPRSTQTAPSGLAELLRYEGEVRRQATLDELLYFIANESRSLITYDQMFVVRRSMVREGFVVQAASSLSLIDRNAPLIQAIEKALDSIGDALQTVDAGTLSDDSALADYPFHSWVWIPLEARDKSVFAALLVARVTPWTENETIRLSRMGQTIAHSWLALVGGKPVRRFIKLDTRTKRWLAAALLLAAMFPVRMTALAPMEVVAAQPFVVSAPYTGVIARLDVAPNAIVSAGQPVVTFEDIKVRNEMQQASEKLAVARAKVERATSAAFADAEEAREIGPLQAELQLAEADYAYARDIMGKSQIRAPKSGMAIYSDRRDWEGRAVNVGDAILQIADPQNIAYRIDLPTKEQMELEPGASVKIWLDAQPLWALDGEIESASYMARQTADGILAFAVTARPVDGTPRIGSRGTAKLYGPWAPFIYTILRRPIATARQYLGL